MSLGVSNTITYNSFLAIVWFVLVRVKDYVFNLSFLQTFRLGFKAHLQLPDLKLQMCLLNFIVVVEFDIRKLFPQYGFQIEIEC